MPKTNSEQPVYLDPKAPINKRITDLLGRMTLDEKIGQMTQISTNKINKSNPGDPKWKLFLPYADTAKIAKLVREYHIGSFLAGFACPAEDWVAFSKTLQTINLKYSRLKIPVIYGNDHIHGANYLQGATVFPHQLNIGCTFNDSVAYQAGLITTAEIAALGQHWNFAPVLGIGRNPYWPRLYETFGESPLLASQMGVAYLKGLQDTSISRPYRVAGCAKHFIGYSDPRQGYDRTPVTIPDQELYEFFVPPFKAAFDAGVKTVMVNSGELNGEAVHGSKKYLSELLRKQLNFNGVILTDWADILQLIGQHHVAQNEYEATKMAIDAGIDMSMTATTTTFCEIMKKLVENGDLTEERIDQSVTRILKLKFELGLFENPLPASTYNKRINNPDYKKKNYQAASQSIVLLKNEENTLPLPANSKVLLAGNAKHSKSLICGGWTIHWNGAPDKFYPDKVATVYNALGQTQLQIDTVGETASQNTFNAKASKADVIIVTMAEPPYAEGKGNINNLNYSPVELETLKKALSTQKPVVLVQFGGRPRLFNNLDKKSKAFIFAGLPGYEGATALAHIIAGKVNPTGRLSFSYPEHVAGHAPFNAKRHAQINNQYGPKYDFGAGLSYHQMIIDTIISQDTIKKPNQPKEILITVTNPTTQKITQPLIVFYTDEYRTITPSYKKLLAYQRITLQPKQTRQVTINYIPQKAFSFPDNNGNNKVEQGDFTIKAGNKKAKLFLDLRQPQPGEGGSKNRTYLQEEL